MDKEAFEKEVVANLRACLVSTKGQCDLRQINRDYRLLMGTEIPYAKLGYSSLEQFICKIPSLTTSRVQGVLYVDAKETEKSSHISAFVNRQKTRKRKTNLYKPPRHSFSSVRTKWQSKGQKKYQSSPRPAVVNHNQFVNVPTPPRQSKLSDRLASRLGPVVNKENVKPQMPLVKRNSLPLQTEEDSFDSMLAKAKERITKKMENININDTTSSFPEDNKLVENSLKYFSPQDVDLITPKSAPVAKVQDLFSWPVANNQAINSEFISTSVHNSSAAAFVPTGDHLADLQAFAALHNLGEPQIKVTTRKTHKQRIYYDCRIKVGNLSFSSYPNDFFNEMAAKQEAAKEALDELIPIYSQKKSLLISDEADILARIPPIVKSHYYGIWKEQLEADYTENFSEQLPTNWLEIVDSLPNISVTPCFDKFVLRYCKPGEVFQKGLNFSLPFVSNVSVPSKALTFEEDNILIAEITCAVSACEIWCRQINTPEAIKFEQMVVDLNQYYDDPKHLEQVETVDVGGYYVALAVNERFWCRVRVFAVTDDVVNCFCIDYADELTVKRNEIYALHAQFARDQAQAFVCRLTGVEEYYEASKSSDYIRTLQGKVVYVQLQDDPDKSDPGDPTSSVVLVDAEDETVVINEQLVISLESALYTVPELKDTPTEVFVRHIEDNGIVYIQVPYFGNKQLTEMLNDLVKSIVNNEIVLPTTPVTRFNSKNKLYLTQNVEDQNWCRAKILDWAPSPKNFAQIQYVDFGNTAVVNLNDTIMYPLVELNETIAKFDEQAKPARMALNIVPPDFKKIVSKLIPQDQPVLTKVVGWGTDSLPLVKFFKRSEPDNLLFSINEAIDSETEVRNANINGKSQSMKMQRLISLGRFEDTTKTPSTGLLPCPPLPKMGEYFDVKIPCAVNPYNFFVQPLASSRKLATLMTDMQERYKDLQYSPLSIHDIIPGKIYASKYDDGLWYRTSVIKVIHSGSISAFYCDFGYYANLTLQQLYPLDEDLLPLPYQGIKAKLAGIQPKHSKWTMDDCKVFEELVRGKCFVSVVTGVETDTYYRYDTILSLKLVDTSTSTDVFIDALLINKGIAVAQ